MKLTIEADGYGYDDAGIRYQRIGGIQGRWALAFSPDETELVARWFSRSPRTVSYTHLTLPTICSV